MLHREDMAVQVRDPLLAFLRHLQMVERMGDVGHLSNKDKAVIKSIAANELIKFGFAESNDW